MCIVCICIACICIVGTYFFIVCMGLKISNIIMSTLSTQLSPFSQKIFLINNVIR